jgi:enoyl-CoA hydratase/carnithine racemase
MSTPGAAPPDPVRTEPDAAAVLLQRHEGWAEIVFNRPHRKNAIHGPFAEAFLQALNEAESDDSLRVLLLRGAGGTFCSGLDLQEFNADPKPAWVADFGTLWRKVHVALASTRKIVLVALERYAINGGAALAIAGDIVIAGTTAQLQVAEIRLGMAAPNNLAWILMRHSEAVAARLALMGDRIPAAELLRLGVATEVVPDDQVVSRCTVLAQEMSQWPAKGVAAIKPAIRRGSLGMSVEDWFASFAVPAAPNPPRLDVSRRQA